LHDVEWRKKIFVASFLLLASVSSAATSLSNIGNWAGEYKQKQVEIAIWFDDDRLATGLVRGYIVNQDDACGIGFVGERVMSVVTTFFGPIKDGELVNWSLEIELRNVSMQGLTLCNPLQTHSRLMLVYDPQSGQASLAGLGEPPAVDHYTNVVKLVSLKRTAASPQMLQILDANPTIDRERGQKNAPNASVRNVFTNPNLNPETVISSEYLPCRTLLRDQQVRMKQMGITSLSATMEPSKKLGVRYEQYSGAIPNTVWSDDFSASKKSQYLQIAASSVSNPALLAMPSGKRGLRFGSDACKQAMSVSEVLTRVENGLTDGSLLATSASTLRIPRIENGDGMYFFDKSGIDQITSLIMTRVFGSTTLFVPGDISREGLWSPQTQSMKLRAMVKHSKSGYIEKDLLSKYNETSFVYDPKLSKKHGSDVWVSVADSRLGGDCIRWREKHFVDNCEMRSTGKMYKQHRYYLSSDLTVAKSIFKEISPNAVTLGAEELANPARGCANGMYCNLPGGLYLNAIYNGSFEIVRALDEQLRTAKQSFTAENMPSFKVGRRDYLKEFMQVVVPTSILPYLANRYMYLYQNLPASCLEPGFKVNRERYVVPDTFDPDTDFNGIVIPGARNPGHTVTAEYKINPVFFKLCDHLCDTSKPDQNDMFLVKENANISRGLDKVLFGQDCNSPEVKQFERNLVTLTLRSIFSGSRALYVERSSL